MQEIINHWNKKNFPLYLTYEKRDVFINGSEELLILLYVNKDGLIIDEYKGKNFLEAFHYLIDKYKY